ncbi:hypothetical protein [Bradyrhizobium sp. UFLA05-153]
MQRLFAKHDSDGHSRRHSRATLRGITKKFTDKEIVDLTMLIGMINLWNRLAIGMRYVHDAG